MFLYSLVCVCAHTGMEQESGAHEFRKARMRMKKINPLFRDRLLHPLIPITDPRSILTPPHSFSTLRYVALHTCTTHTHTFWTLTLSTDSHNSNFHCSFKQLTMTLVTIDLWSHDNTRSDFITFLKNPLLLFSHFSLHILILHKSSSVILSLFFF